MKRYPAPKPKTFLSSLPPPPITKLPTSNEPPTLPPNLMPQHGRRNVGPAQIVSIAKHHANEICAAGIENDGHEQRVARMQDRLLAMFAEAIEAYEDRTDLLIEVCEHGCSINPNYGFVTAAGCPDHD